MYTRTPATGGSRFEDVRYGRLREAAMTKKLGVAWVDVTAGATSPAHYHTRTQELYYITGGAGTMVLDGAETPVGPGDAVAIPPGVVHAIRAGEEGLELVCVSSPPYDVRDDIEVPLHFRGPAAGAGVVVPAGGGHDTPTYGILKTLDVGFCGQSTHVVHARPGQTTARHLHPYSEEVFTVISGTATMSANGGVFEVGPDEVVVIPAGIRHNLAAGPDGVHYLCTYGPGVLREDDYVEVADGINE
jgi:mannose-6-phosphate isomerase-like protein (cupin superfamily)